MKFRETIIRNYNDLPGYNMVGYSEVAVPMYQRRVHILALVQKSISVVEDFVLNLYNEGIELDDIKLILGLEQQLVDEAFAGLIQRDYINNLTKKVTELGIEYLRNNSVEALEKEEFLVIIDGMTGEIKKYNNNLMIGKNIKSKGIKALRANIEKPEVGNLEFKELRKVFNQYKELDGEIYQGNIIDVIHLEGNTTKYKRVDMLIFQNKDNDVRVIVFDGFNRIDNYEECVKELDARGIKLINETYSEYFESEQVRAIDRLLASSENIESVQYELINKEYDEIIEINNGNIFIVLPLVSMCKVTEAFIEKLERNIRNNARITILVSGIDFIGETQKKLYKKIKHLSTKSKEFTIYHTPKYLNKMFLNLDKKEGIISVYEKNNISLKTTNEGIVESFFKVKEEAFDSIYNIIKDEDNGRRLLKFDLSKMDKKELNKKIQNIIYLAKDADGYMYSNDNIGWIGNDEIPDINRLSQIPLANNEENFRIFIDSLNKSFVESLENNAKPKYKNYFWKEFKEQYPKLQNTLNKIKTYRNKSNHLELNYQNKQRYYSFLKEDINGYMPEFIENGYLILQFKLLDELELNIKSLIQILK